MNNIWLNFWGKAGGISNYSPLCFSLSGHFSNPLWISFNLPLKVLENLEKFLFGPGISWNFATACPWKWLKMSLKFLECPGILFLKMNGHHVIVMNFNIEHYVEHHIEIHSSKLTGDNVNFMYIKIGWFYSCLQHSRLQKPKNLQPKVRATMKQYFEPWKSVKKLFKDFWCEKHLLKGMVCPSVCVSHFLYKFVKCKH